MKSNINVTLHKWQGVILHTAYSKTKFSCWSVLWKILIESFVNKIERDILVDDNNEEHKDDYHDGVDFLVNW